MKQLEFATTLCELLRVANRADTSPFIGQDWQVPHDASSRWLYGDLERALYKVAGREFCEHFSATNEIDESLLITNRVQ